MSNFEVPICCQKAEGNMAVDYDFHAVMTLIHPYEKTVMSANGKASPLDCLASLAFQENDANFIAAKFNTIACEGREKITVVPGPSGNSIKLHKGNGRLAPIDLSKPFAKKCRNRECNNLCGQAGKPRSIYCSKRCQSREQNLRQGRIKNVRSPTPTNLTSVIRRSDSPRNTSSPVPMSQSPRPNPTPSPTMSFSPVPMSGTFAPIPMSGSVPSAAQTPILLPRPTQPQSQPQQAAAPAPIYPKPVSAVKPTNAPLTFPTPSTSSFQPSPQKKPQKTDEGSTNPSGSMDNLTLAPILTT